ncbi:MAG TPA: TolC family protein [Candidatus Eisenbacteria bacterium]|nr:TolC family protein [Candidatus Eisenbacteria bacterium]
MSRTRTTQPEYMERVAVRPRRTLLPFLAAGTAVLMMSLLIAVRALAQTGASPDTTAPAATPVPQFMNAPTQAGMDSALAVMLQEIAGEPLSLDEAIRLALEGGSTLARRAAAELASARGTLRREHGAFDPELFADILRSDREIRTANVFQGADVLREETTTGVAGLRMLLPFGTELEASVDGNRSSSNSEFNLFDPAYGADGRLSVRQPLLRGLGPGTSSESKAARREEEAAVARFDDARFAAEALVEQAYWDLYAAERDLGVQRLIVEQAEALERQAELRARTGLVGPVDVATARVFLSEQRQFLLDREEDLDRISDRLASVIGRRPQTGARFHPTDTPPERFPIEPEQEVVNRAIRQNRDLAARERDLAAARARVQGAGWNRLPRLDVLGSIGGTGLTGRSDTLGIDESFGDAFSDATSREFPTWSAGVSLSFPLLLREGRGEYDRLRGEAERLSQIHEEQRRVIEEQVRAAHRALVRAERRLEAARLGVDASREQARIGVLQYRSGQTTAFELVRLGTDLATAQQRFSQALVRTAKAASVLKFLTSGSIPDTNGGETRP